MLGVEAYFRGCFAGNFFYLKIDEGMFSKPFIRVKGLPSSHNTFFLIEVEMYDYDSGLYVPASVTDKDMAFMLHVIKSYHAVITKADKKWRDKVAKMDDLEFEEIPV